MSKTYPPISYTETRPMTMTRNFPFAETKMDVLVKEVKRITTSGTTPNWPDVIQENGFSTQTTVFTVYPRYFDPFNGDPNWPGFRYVSTIGSPAFSDCPKSIKDQCEYLALLDFYDRIPGVTANLALLFAERKKTYESVLTAVLGILKCVREVKRGKVPELFMDARTLRGRKRYTGAWLNYTYGIKPFVTDLYAIKNSDLRQVVYTKGEKRLPYELRRNTGKIGYIYNRGTYKVTYVGGLSLADPINATLAGAGLTNPALIAWEMTPFSFMADWLLPVGPYLETLSSTGGFNKHPGSVTRGLKEEYRQLNEQYAFATGKFRYVRRATISFPGPPLPRLKNPFSPIHALNALSIIHQFVKEKK